MDLEAQQFPALNIRLGSPEDKADATLVSIPSSTPPANTTLPSPLPTMQGDDPVPLYEYNYELDVEEEENKERAMEDYDALEEEEEEKGNVTTTATSPYPLYNLPAYSQRFNNTQDNSYAQSTTYNHRNHHHHHHHTTEHPTSDYDHTTNATPPHPRTPPIPTPTSPRRRRAHRDMKHRKKFAHRKI